MNKIAIIDMGTNTFHLLVAEIVQDDFKIVVNDRLPVRLGVGGFNQGIITTEAVNRAVEAVRKFKIKTESWGVKKVLAFGTSALRSAKNGIDVVLKIKEATGIDAKIISGEEEARYIYEGVNLALKLGKEKTLIVDIGGGSVEFIIGNGEEVFWKHSFDIGAQRLLEQFQIHDPILAREIKELESYFSNSLKPLEIIAFHKPNILAGSSGSFDTLSEIYCMQSEIPPGSKPETPFDINDFEKIYLELISKNREERMQIPGMIELRVDMIVVASCLIRFILTKFTFEKIRVSSYSLKEGVLVSMIKKEIKA
jgi:exopolyphosphatase / guanosine-5'-triphosphate,3'-diphosphate pyrophosphatase